MAKRYALDDLSSLDKKIDARAHDLFKEKKGHAGLQVTRVFRRKSSKGVGEKNCFVKNLDVCDSSQVEGMRENNQDDMQLYTIRQDRSWTTLNISRDLFQCFTAAHGIMAPFWKHVFTFGRKSEENEFQFPQFCRRRRTDSGVKVHEYAYMLRRVELNGRAHTEDDNPWSIRQTAVYHRLSAPKTQSLKSTFLLIAPSENVEDQFGRCLSQSNAEDGMALSPWNVHRILVADSLRGWMDYMAYLEKGLKEQSDHIVLASVGDDKVNLSPLTDFVINFDNRQQLKIIEDQVLDLQVILPGMLDAVEQLLREFSSFQTEEDGELNAIVGEFEEYVREVKMLVERSKALNDMARSTARLLSDLLSYEEAVSLKKLSIETQIESKSMCHLAEKSTKDAAAVKILTVITLIYLPTTIVANFFSTQFVQTTDGHMNVAPNVWLLAAIAVPLTLLTILLWWTWVHFTEVKPMFNPLQPGTVTLQRQHSFRSMVSSKKSRQKQGDLEMGMSFQVPPMLPVRGSPTSTWNSQASTVKIG
ncbi:uncharacterized protein LY89DRAFT_640613 [Mollisia scopiformis]|uniref:CorA-like transporter domain-containing protein n=1 Tax=Mollisia scopiformis TaxID=149040 RepID=A0A194XKT7_MOLSC|nr:uncharacterized protein LY89DRAFT_640613 [Mollisia scopiformis]KUJ20793.1 hypothetical protein LY89DRAFT_640613 [Mollisia scopiformis]